MDQLPARNFLRVVNASSQPEQPIVVSEARKLARPINRVPKRYFTPARKSFFKAYAHFFGIALVAGLVAAFIIGRKIPSITDFKELKNDFLADIGKVVRENSSQNVIVPIDAKISPELAASIRQEVTATIKEAGLVIAQDAPIFKKMKADNIAQQRVILDLSKAKTKAENEAQKERSEKTALVDELDLVQQKLEKSGGKDREGIVKDAVAHLNRDDVEALLLLEQLTVRESSGRIKAYGPWVQMKVWVQKKNVWGKPTMILVNKPGPYNPWIKVVKGVPYDRAYGMAQIMGENIPQWSEEATGIRYTPELLIREPDVYRKVALFQIRKLLQTYKHNPDDVISVWHSGRPLSQAKAQNSRDVNMSTSDYVKQVKSASVTDSGVWKNAREQ